MSDQREEYEEWIAENHPEHDRTSCNDDNLYNAGTVMLRHRCERCEALSQLKAWSNEQELRALREQKPYAYELPSIPPRIVLHPDFNANYGGTVKPLYAAPKAQNAPKA